jgi:hypothetical protein
MFPPVHGVVVNSDLCGSFFLCPMLTSPGLDELFPFHVNLTLISTISLHQGNYTHNTEFCLSYDKRKRKQQKDEELMRGAGKMKEKYRDSVRFLSTFGCYSERESRQHEITELHSISIPYVYL